MDQKRKLFLLDKINIEIEKRIRGVEAAREISKDYQTAALGSASIGGDRLHAENNEQIQKSQLSLLKNVREQIENGFVRFIVVEYQDGQRKEFYLLRSNVTIPEILIVTPDSPLGAVLQGKKQSDSFSYLVGDKKLNGKIISLEKSEEETL